MVDNKTKRKLDGKRLSKQPYERRYMAKKCKELLKERDWHIISDSLTKTSVRKLVRYYLKHYKNV